jgi:protein-tyrosine-phosphatase
MKETTNTMTTNIFILCPHNAAKSVVAAAFLRRRAALLDLNVQVTTAGTDPDPDILPIVRARLEAEGFTLRAGPRTVRQSDLAAAELIINMGCNHDLLPTSQPIEDWSVPNFSDDPDAAFDAIQANVAELSTRLSEDYASAG